MRNISAHPRWRSVIFDLDGTLIDSAQTILTIINEMRMERAGAPVCITDIRPHLSKGGHTLVAEALGECARDADADLLAFRTRYVEQQHGPEILFPHCINVLKMLSETNIPLAICTNKPTLLAQNALRLSGLIDFFSVVVAGDDVTMHKPDPQPLLLTAERLNADAQDCLYVGDSEADGLAAQQAGMDFVFATYGYPVCAYSDIAMIGRVGCLSELAVYLGGKMAGKRRLQRSAT